MARETYEGKRPAFQFYPGDWLRDTALRMCSVGARGLWIDMLCIMHQGEPYGYLTVNGKPIDITSLSRMVGESPKTISKQLEELEAAQVFSRNDQQVIYSRRMVKDEHLRQVRAASGKKGGNPSLLDKHELNHLLNQTAKQTPTPSSSSSSSSSNTPSSAPGGVHVPEIYQTDQVTAAIERFAQYYRQKKGEPFDAFMRQATFERAFGAGWSAEKLCKSITFSISKGWLSVYEDSEKADRRGSQIQPKPEPEYQQLPARRRGGQ